MSRPLPYLLGLVALLFWARPVQADTFHLLSPTAAGVTTNPGQRLVSSSTANSGFTPTAVLNGTTAYWYSSPLSGAFAAGAWSLLIWSNAPGCSSIITAEIGSTNTDGSGFVSLGQQSVDFNQPGNHPNTFSFNPGFVSLSNKLLRVSLKVSSGCNSTIAYNAGVDFDSRLITTSMGAAGTATVSPTHTHSPTLTPTPLPPLTKSVNRSTAALGDTLTFTLNYQNPNPATGANCGDDFETGSTAWPGGWAAPTGGTWTTTAANGPSAGGSKALDAQTTGGYMFTTINCAGNVTDGSLQTDAKIFSTGGELTLLWRQNGSSTYQFHVTQGSASNLSLRVITNGAFNEIAVGSTAINVGQWYALKLVVSGFSLQAWVNGVMLLTATDPNTTYSAGAAGIEIDDAPAAGMHAQFDNVIISKAPLAWHGVSITDTLPAGLSYVSNSCGGTANGQVVSIPLGDLAAGASGACRIVAVVNSCPATLPNQADFHVALPQMGFTSNSVTTTASCSTPTRTGTPTPSRTRTASPSASPTATPSPTPSASPSATPSVTRTTTATATATASPTRTMTATVTPSLSPSATPTASRSATATSTGSATPSATLSATASATPSESPSATATPTRTPTATPSASPTASPTNTDGPSPTPSSTPSSSPTMTPTSTSSSTPSVSPSATASMSSSQTPSSTSSRTATRTLSPSITPTASPTRTATPSDNPTLTSSPSRTQSPTQTLSPTVTPTPQSLPIQLKIQVYNSAGERVRLLFEGPSAVDGSGLRTDQSALIPGQGGVALLVPGPSGSQLLATWEGLNDQGQAVSSGVYTLSVTALDPFGQSVSSFVSVQVLAAPRSEPAAIDIYNSAGERVASLLLPSTSAIADLRPLNKTFAASDGQGLVLQYVDSSGQPQTVSWDGRGENGAALSSGSYWARSRGSDSILISGLVLLAGPEQALSTPLIGPQPATPGVTALTVRCVGAVGAWEAELFSLAGERVARESASGSQLQLSLDGLSEGLYLVQVRCQDADGRWHRWVRKAAVVR